MKKFRRKMIRDPILGFVFYVQFGGTEFEAYKWFESHYGDSGRVPQSIRDDGVVRNLGSFGAPGYDLRYRGVIWLHKDCGGSTIAHEVAHAVTNVCRVLELNPVDADEFYSSYLGWLFKEVNILIQGKKK